MAINYLSKNLKNKEFVDIVTKNGKTIGKATRSQVYKEGLLHPAVNIIVINRKGQIFIQRRNSNKILPLYWDISASEHVKSGEDYKTAAKRGLKEELSISSPVKLLRSKHIQRNEYIKGGICIIEHELVELYYTIYDDEIKVNQEEVKEGKFIDLQELSELIKNHQIQFSPWGTDEINYLIVNYRLLFK